MLKVLRHGSTIAVRNPVSGAEETMVNIVFVEAGRGGANSQLAQSQDFLSQLEGENVGLIGFRTHTQPVLKEKQDKYPIGREIPGHINRALYSRPQIGQQEGRDPRMIDGKPTYFTTWMSNTPEEDADYRDSNEILARTNPGLLQSAHVRAAEVRVLEEGKNTGDPEGILAKMGLGSFTKRQPQVVANQ